jgi:aspartate aminotransferase
MATAASETYTTTSAPIQYAAVRAFQGGISIERYLWNSRRVLAALARWITRRLSGIGLDIERPKGAFYLFPDFAPFRDKLAQRGVRDSASLCEALFQDTGVAMLPGSAFGRRSDELTARLAYVDFDGAHALAAAEVIPADRALGQSFLENHCRNVLTAIDQLCDWLTG